MGRTDDDASGKLPLVPTTTSTSDQGSVTPGGLARRPDRVPSGLPATPTSTVPGSADSPARTVSTTFPAAPPAAASPTTTQDDSQLPSLGSLPSKPPSLTIRRSSSANPSSSRNGGQGSGTASRLAQTIEAIKSTTVDLGGDPRARLRGESASIQAPEQDNEIQLGRILQRLMTLESAQEKDAATWRRLNEDHKILEDKVDHVSQGCDVLAAKQIAQKHLQDNTCRDDVNGLTGTVKQLQTTISSLENRLSKCCLDQTTGSCSAQPTPSASGAGSRQPIAGPSGQPGPSPVPGAASSHSPSSRPMAQGPTPPVTSAPFSARLPTGAGAQSVFAATSVAQGGGPVPVSAGIPMSNPNTPGGIFSNPIFPPNPYGGYPQGVYGGPWNVPMSHVPTNVGGAPLDTESQVPVAPPVPQDNTAITGLPENPHCPGILAPHRVSIPSFRSAVDYRTYRLRLRRAELTPYESANLHFIKKQVEGYSRQATFSGTPATGLLEFLTTVVDALERSNVVEGVASFIVPDMLTDAALDVHRNLRNSYHPHDNPHAATWPHLVHGLIKHFLTDNVMQELYNTVIGCKQAADEDETQFCTRVIKASNSGGRNLFNKSEVALALTRGLLPAIRDRVTDQFSRLPTAEQHDPTAVQRLAEVEGRALREGLKWTQDQFKTPIKGRPGTSKALVVTNSHQPLTPFTPIMPITSRATPAAPSPYGDFFLKPPPAMTNLFVNEHGQGVTTRMDGPFSLASSMNVFEHLDTVLTTAPIASPDPAAAAAGMISSLNDVDLINRPIDVQTIPTPALTEEQLKLAMQVVPEDYWNLSCWTCRDEGHSTFTCPYLNMAQRLFFAFKFYEYQIRGQPHMESFLRQKAENRRQRLTAPTRYGRQDSQGTANRSGSPGGGGRGRGGFRPQRQGPSSPGQGQGRPWLRPNSPGHRQVRFDQNQPAGGNGWQPRTPVQLITNPDHGGQGQAAEHGPAHAGQADASPGN